VVDLKEKGIDEVGFYDYDHWIQGQDCDEKTSVRVLNVSRMEEKSAITHIEINNLGRRIRLEVPLVFERNDWFIDNFVENYKGELLDEKQNLKDYLQ